MGRRKEESHLLDNRPLLKKVMWTLRVPCSPGKERQRKRGDVDSGSVRTNEIKQIY